MQSILSDHGGLHSTFGKQTPAPSLPILGCWFKEAAEHALGKAGESSWGGASGLPLPRDRLPRGVVVDSPGDNWGLSVSIRHRDRGPSTSDSPEREIIT